MERKFPSKIFVFVMAITHNCDNFYCWSQIFHILPSICEGFILSSQIRFFERAFWVRHKFLVANKHFFCSAILTQHRHICWQTTYLYSSLFLVTTDSVLFLLCDLFCKQPSLVSQSFGHSKSFMKILKSFLCFQWTTSNTHIYVGNQGGWIKLRTSLGYLL